MKLNNSKGSRGKRTSVGNRRHGQQDAGQNEKEEKCAETCQQKKSAKPLRKNASNGRIESLSSREKRGNNARKIGKTGKNRGTKKYKCMGEGRRVAKTLREMLLGLGHVDLNTTY